MDLKITRHANYYLNTFVQSNRNKSDNTNLGSTRKRSLVTDNNTKIALSFNNNDPLYLPAINDSNSLNNNQVEDNIFDFLQSNKIPEDKFLSQNNKNFIAFESFFGKNSESLKHLYQILIDDILLIDSFMEHELTKIVQDKHLSIYPKKPAKVSINFSFCDKTKNLLIKKEYEYNEFYGLDKQDNNQQPKADLTLLLELPTAQKTKCFKPTLSIKLNEVATENIELKRTFKLIGGETNFLKKISNWFYNLLEKLFGSNCFNTDHFKQDNQYPLQQLKNSDYHNRKLSISNSYQDDNTSDKENSLNNFVKRDVFDRRSMIEPIIAELVTNNIKEHQEVELVEGSLGEPWNASDAQQWDDEPWDTDTSGDKQWEWDHESWDSSSDKQWLPASAVQFNDQENDQRLDNISILLDDSDIEDAYEKAKKTIDEIGTNTIQNIERALAEINIDAER